MFGAGIELPPEYDTSGMTTGIDELTKLPLPRRLEIVERLWDSIAADPEQLPVTAKQAEELDRRLAAHESNPGEGVIWEEIRDRLRKSR
jgi:putative addiction module component (TIGR02574 family)